MKILMVTMSLGIGGAETHIVELSRALAARGVEVHVASAGGVYESALEEAGIPHTTLPLDRKTPFALLRARRGLATLLRREHFDVVHAHARIPAFLCGTLQKKFGFRFVTTDHGMFRLTPLLRRLSNWGEYTFAVSRDIRDYLIANYHLNPAHIVLTVNGIDTERFSPSADVSLRAALSADGKPLVLHVSRLDRTSSVCAKALIGAVKTLAGRVRLVLVGDGDYADVLREHAGEVNAALGFDAVTFVGARTDVEKYLAACDLFVGPSRAAMEAMACGKPTVLSGSEGHGGIFCPELEAAAVASNFCFRGAALPTAEVLAGEIETLLAMSAEERTSLGALGRKFIQRHYSIATMTETQLAIYEKIVAYRTGGTPDVVICGYYGYGNAGDDALLSGIVEGIRRIDPSLRLSVMSAHPKQTRAYEIVDAVNRFRLTEVRRALRSAKLFLFGGGNLLQDKTSTHSLLYYTKMLRMAKRCGASVMIYANGIGPVTGKMNIYRVGESLELADSISLRDKDSFDFAKKFVPEKNVRLTFDPAVLAGAGKSSSPDTEKPYFVVAPKKTAPDASEGLAALIRYLRERYFLTPILLSMYDAEDLDYTKKLAVETGAEIVCPTGADAYVELLSRASLMISSRLHGLIYATAAACPMMSLSDDGKLASYLDYIGLGTGSTIPCAADVYADTPYLCMMADRILAEEKTVRRILSEGLPIWRALAEYEFSEAVRAVREHGRGEDYV